MRLSYAIAPILILIFLSTPGSPQTLSAHFVSQVSTGQSTPQTYVKFMHEPTDSAPSPWILYPTNTIVWVAGISSGIPPSSQIREYFVDNSTSKPVVSLANITVSSLVADSRGRVWFTDNSTLSYYDIQNRNVTKTLTFPNQNLWYLALDHQERIWMTVLASNGASKIVMFDPTDGSNRTYRIPTSNAFIQGITIAPDNTVWFAEAGSEKLGRLACDGCSVDEFPAPSSLNLASITQVAVDHSGIAWFTDHAGDNQFGMFNPETSTWKTFPIGYCADACVSGLPNSIFVGPQNEIWFSEHIAGRVARYDPTSDVLTEYVVSHTPTALPLVWWAEPGANNLVWFVANGLGEVGYVNASLPIPLVLTGTSSDFVIQKGFSTNIPVTVNFHGVGTLTFGVSPLTQDQPSSELPAQLYGSGPSDIGPSPNPQTATISLSASWSATSGARYVALTATENNVAVSTHVRVVVVEASAPVVALGLSSVILLGGVTIYLRRPKRLKLPAVKRTRR
jgi:streptogramin lyase